MRIWNSISFKTAIKNLKAAHKQGLDNIDSKGYDLRLESEIHLYIADVILNQEVEGSTVYEWTKKRSNGPREDWQVKKLEKFFAIQLSKEEGDITMKEKHTYSNFVQEKVFEVHKAIMDYLDERGDEVAYWSMQNTIDQCRVALPDSVYDAVQGFIDQYLEKDLFGAIYSQKERVNIDLSKFELTEENCPNSECGTDHVEWFKLQTMYDMIAMDYIRPIFNIA